MTFDEFTYRWQRLHHPSMDVRSDVSFFYGLYLRLHAVVEQEARQFSRSELLRLVLYAENIIAVGLDGVYEYRYRSVGDVVCRYCNRWQLPAGATSHVHRLLSEAVADAPASALRRWMLTSVLSGRFQWLSGMLTYIAREDSVLRLALPDLRFRKSLFRRLTGNRLTARRMLWADIAFNWHDKCGCSLSATIADRFRHSFPTDDAQERSLLKAAALALDTLQSQRPDTYTLVGSKDDRTLTLRHRDGRLFPEVTAFTPLSGAAPGSFLFAQLVTYAGRTYLSGPVQPLDSTLAAACNGDLISADLTRKEQDSARQRYFITPFGRRICLYDDLYTLPEDPEEARDADWGIYRDEPEVLDFLCV